MIKKSIINYIILYPNAVNETFKTSCVSKIKRKKYLFNNNFQNFEMRILLTQKE